MAPAFNSSMDAGRADSQASSTPWALLTPRMSPSRAYPARPDKKERIGSHRNLSDSGARGHIAPRRRLTDGEGNNQGLN